MDHMLKETYFMKDPFSRVNIKLVLIFAHLGSTRVTRILVIFPMLVLLLSAIASKIAKIANSSNDLILLAELIPSIASLAGCAICIIFEYILNDHVKLLLIHVRNDARKKRAEAEVAIKQVYEGNALLLIRLITLSGTLGLLGFVATLFIPHFLDVVWPINETRPRYLPFHGEHLVDEEVYFYHIAIYQYTTCGVVLMVMGSVISGSVLAVFQLCGMTSVFGYKVENMVQIVRESVGPNAIDYDKKIIHEIKVCCDEYKSIWELFYELNYMANLMIPFLLLGTFISFSMLLVTIVNVESIGVSNALFTIAAIAQFALFSFLGQYVVNESSKLQYNVYNALWYDVPPKIQRLFMLMMLRTQKLFVISAVTYELTVGSFAVVVKTAMSFCMVLKETQ